MNEMEAPGGCCIRLLDLPYSVGAVVSLDDEGYASIYLNSRLSYEDQCRNLRHELHHIYNGDLYSEASIIDAEAAASIEQEDAI